MYLNNAYPVYVVWKPLIKDTQQEKNVSQLQISVTRRPKGGFARTPTNPPPPPTVAVSSTSQMQGVGHEYHLEHGSHPDSITQIAIAAVHRCNVIHAQYVIFDLR